MPPVLQPPRLEASLSFSTSLRGVSVGGRVFGISSTVVNPPAAAAAVPVAKSSLYASPMSRRCTWTSMRPGRAHNPDASIASWLPASVLRDVFLILPSSMRIEPLVNPCPVQMFASLTRIFWSSKSGFESALFFCGAKFLRAVLAEEDAVFLN